MTPEAHHRIADQLARQGQFAEAEKHLLTAVRAKPDFGAAHYLLSTIRRYTVDDEHLAMLKTQNELPGSEPRNQSRLVFALAKALAQLGHYDEAFDSFQEANRLRQIGTEFDVAREWDRVHRRIQLFDSALFSKLNECGYASSRPVFVVSMPRSGSTLVEHILDCHPQAHGIGESKLVPQLLGRTLANFVPAGAAMPDIDRVPPETWTLLGESYVAQTNANADRIIDKQPFNYRLLGEIRLMLPDARIIWCIREPLDTCLSCYTTAFRNAPPFCNSLEDLGAAYRMHEALMRHWQTIMPEAIHTLEYEKLVTDPESAVRQLLDFVGLDWNPVCLEFHLSNKSVTTASQIQVRQPLYGHSVGNWKNYEGWLQPLQAALDAY